jgi:uncharacterized membrane protein YhiD involved in acid resistance
VAAIGMAAGAAMYAVAGFGTLIILMTLLVLGRVERFLPRSVQQAWLVEVTLGPDVGAKEMERLVTEHCRSVQLQELETSGERKRILFQAEIATRLDLEEISKKMQAAGADAVTWTAYGNAEVELAL